MFSTIPVLLKGLTIPTGTDNAKATGGVVNLCCGEPHINTPTVTVNSYTGPVSSYAARCSSLSISLTHTSGDHVIFSGGILPGSVSSSAIYTVLASPARNNIVLVLLQPHVVMSYCSYSVHSHVSSVTTGPTMTTGGSLYGKPEGSNQLISLHTGTLESCAEIVYVSYRQP